MVKAEDMLSFCFGIYFVLFGILFTMLIIFVIVVTLKNIFRKSKNHLVYRMESTNKILSELMIKKMLRDLGYGILSALALVLAIGINKMTESAIEFVIAIVFAVALAGCLYGLVMSLKYLLFALGDLFIELLDVIATDE